MAHREKGHPDTKDVLDPIVPTQKRSVLNL